jgi:hypothetical protein
MRVPFPAARITTLTDIIFTSAARIQGVEYIKSLQRLALYFHFDKNQGLASMAKLESNPEWGYSPYLYFGCFFELFSYL